jgi:hypothetical protein
LKEKRPFHQDRLGTNKHRKTSNKRTLPFLRSQEALPIVTSEIGDTWIYGLQADPKKTKAVRLMLRERARAIKVRPLSLFLSLSLSRALALFLCVSNVVNEKLDCLPRQAQDRHQTAIENGGGFSHRLIRRWRRTPPLSTRLAGSLS